MVNIFRFVLEMVGIVAFAISGALCGIRKHLDLFGVVMLGVVTSVGGGVIRDLILGHTPPMAFLNPVYGLVAAGISLLVFLPSVRSFLLQEDWRVERILLVMDSLGLGIFVSVGVKIAMEASANVYLLVFVGTISGVGGSLTRDVLSGETPVIFRKHFYCLAAIIGSVVILLLWKLVGETASMLIGAALIFLLRILAAKYRWSMPRA